MRKFLTYIVCIVLSLSMVCQNVNFIDPILNDNKLIVNAEELPPYIPNFDNKAIWSDDNKDNPYVPAGYQGQCTWFAWNVLEEFYGGDYHPSFSGNGEECVGDIVAAEPENWVESSTPIAGSLVSFKPNHVAVVTYQYDDGTYDLWEGNISYEGHNAWLDRWHGTSEQAIAEKNYMYWTNVTQADIESRKTWTTYANPTLEMQKRAKYGGPVKEEQKKELKDKGVLHQEWDLKGMPQQSPLMEDMKDAPNLTTKDDLTMAEKIKLENIKADIKATKVQNNQKIFNAVIALVGICISLYAMLLIIAFQFDKTNVFYDFSLVSILTFNKLNIEADDFKYRGVSDGVRHINSKQFYIFTGCVFAFSLLWLTGGIQRILYPIVDFLLKIFHGG